MCTQRKKVFGKLIQLLMLSSRVVFYMLLYSYQLDEISLFVCFYIYILKRMLEDFICHKQTEIFFFPSNKCFLLNQLSISSQPSFPSYFLKTEPYWTSEHSFHRRTPYIDFSPKTRRVLRYQQKLRITDVCKGFFY